MTYRHVLKRSFLVIVTCVLRSRSTHSSHNNKIHCHTRALLQTAFHRHEKGRHLSNKKNKWTFCTLTF